MKMDMQWKDGRRGWRFWTGRSGEGRGGAGGGGRWLNSTTIAHFPFRAVGSVGGGWVDSAHIKYTSVSRPLTPAK